MGLGGFSSHDASFGFWNSRASRPWPSCSWCCLASVFVRYFMVIRSRSLRPIWSDREIRTTWWCAAVGVPGGGASLFARRVSNPGREALRNSAFHVVSVATTTGYAVHRLRAVARFCAGVADVPGLLLCRAGSTGGGIKMVRMVLLVKQARRELVRIIHPGGQPVSLGRKALPPPS